MSDDPYAEFEDDDSVDDAGDASPFRMPVTGHLMCRWPLILVLIGGAIGGGLGGMAYAINASVYRSDLPVPAKIVLNLAIGGVTFVLWILIVMGIRMWRQPAG